MAALNMTTFEYALKELYPKDKIVFQAHKNSQFFTRIKKDENFTGEVWKQPVQYGHGAGVSHTFATAQALKSEIKGIAFLVTQAEGYSLASLTNQVVVNSRGNEGALLNALQTEMDGAIGNLSRQMSVELFRDRTGSIGVSAGIATSTVSLATRSDINNFHVGMTVVTAANSTSALSNATGDVISAVNRSAGTFDVATTNNTYTATYLIFAKGDYVSSSDRLAIAGLSAWVPDTAPTATTFFGVARNVDTDRLGGIRLSGATGRVDELIYEAACRCAEEGGTPNWAICSYGRYNVLQQELGSKVQYTRQTYGDAKVGTVGFSSIVVPGPAGDIEVWPDRFCPDSRAFVLTGDSWVLASAGPAPHIDDLDGRSVLREASAAALEVRVQYFGNLVCKCPGYNAVVHTMPAI